MKNAKLGLQNDLKNGVPWQQVVANHKIRVKPIQEHGVHRFLANIESPNNN